MIKLITLLLALFTGVDTDYGQFQHYVVFTDSNKDGVLKGSVHNEDYNYRGDVYIYGTDFRLSYSYPLDQEDPFFVADISEDVVKTLKRNVPAGRWQVVYEYDDEWSPNNVAHNYVNLVWIAPEDHLGLLFAVSVDVNTTYHQGLSHYTNVYAEKGYDSFFHFQCFLPSLQEEAFATTYPFGFGRWEAGDYTY
jgi:hypothetical protein